MCLKRNFTVVNFTSQRLKYFQYSCLNFLYMKSIIFGTKLRNVWAVYRMNAHNSVNLSLEITRPRWSHESRCTHISSWIQVAKFSDLNGFQKCFCRSSEVTLKSRFSANVKIPLTQLISYRSWKYWSKCDIKSMSHKMFYSVLLRVDTVRRLSC